MTGNAKQDHRLETYLSSLERVLKPFPVGDRAEIVTEIKSHILDALARDPQTRLDTVLSALGEPEMVANRYLLERGLKPAKPPISPIVKWMVVGFLGTVAMLLIFVGFLLSRFHPLITIDEPNNKLTLLGGLIKLDGDKGTFKLEGPFGGFAAVFDGSSPLNPGQSAFVKFTNGKFDIRNSDENQFNWSCRGAGSAAPKQMITDNTGLKLDLTTLVGADCELEIPENAKLIIEGANGKIELDNPRFSIGAKVTNGKIAIDPDESQEYIYDLSVTTGKIDKFVSSDKPNALAISIKINNGKISREN